MHIKVLFLLFFVILLCHADAQKDIMTTSGQKITIQSDGTWHYTENSTLIEKKYPAFLSEEHKRTINKMGDIAKAAEIQCFLELDSLVKRKDVINMQISQANKLNNKDSKKYYEALFNETERKISIFQKKYEESSKVIYRIEQLRTYDKNNLYRELSALSSELQIDIPKNENPTSTSVAVELKPTVKPSKEKFSLPKNQCSLSLDSVIHKSRVLQLNDIYMSSYTPEKLKTYFKNKEFLTSFISVSSIGNQKRITVTHKLISKDAAKYYGYIPQASLTRISLITGKNIDLYSMEDSYPTTENYTGNMVYKAEYIISKGDYKTLSKSPIDTIGCMWSSGFETYTVYEVDVLIRLINCLEMFLK